MLLHLDSFLLNMIISQLDDQDFLNCLLISRKIYDNVKHNAYHRRVNLLNKLYYEFETITAYFGYSMYRLDNQDFRYWVNANEEDKNLLTFTDKVKEYYGLENYNTVGINQEHFILIDDINLIYNIAPIVPTDTKVPEEFLQYISREKLDEWYSLTMDQLVDIDHYSKFGSLCQWFLITPTYNIPIIGLNYCALAYDAVNQRVACVSCVSGDGAEGITTVKIIYDTYQDYCSDLNKWLEREYQPDHPQYHTILQELEELNRERDENDEDELIEKIYEKLEIICTKFCGYVTCKNRLIQQW